MIEAKNISVAFGSKIVLDGFSLALPETGVVCILGPSGCGKTTLVRTIAGLQKPDGGRVTGLNPGDTSFMFQEDRLFPWLTAAENIRAVTGEDPKPWLERVGLLNEKDSLPASLSGGMRRRIALARALAYGGKLLILDEPFKGFDPELRLKMFALIRSAANSKPVILITHDTADVNALADVVLRFDGPPLILTE